MSLRRGIEPIIATVILVAVALIIAVAVVGYLMGLFGGLTGGQPQISITSISAKLGSQDNIDIEMYINNAGSGSDRLIRVEVIHGNKLYTLSISATSTGTSTITGTSIIISGNSKNWYTFTASVQGASVGDSIIVKVYFEKSGVQTINLVIAPGSQQTTS